MSRSADVVIIGAGILGASVAHHLATSGVKVAILERGAPNREGSGATAGNVHVQAIHTSRPGQAVAVDSRRLVPLQKAASDRWSNVETELEADVELQRAGGFMVAETPDQARELTEKSSWEAAAGVKTELLDADATRAALPGVGPSVMGATWCPLDGYANPLLITHAYLAGAIRAGAELHTYDPVLAIGRRGDGWRSTTSRATFDSAAVVNTAGPWITDVAAMAGLRLPMAPVAIQMHATVRTPVVMRHLVQHIARGLSVKQVAAGNVLIGGGWPARRLDLAGRSQSSVASLVGNVAEATRILPFLASLRLLRMWSGPLAATPDEMPVIGPVPDADGFYVIGGTYAFTFAPLWGEIVSAAIRGDTPPVDVSDLGPGRFMKGDVHA